MCLLKIHTCLIYQSVDSNLKLLFHLSDSTDYHSNIYHSNISSIVSEMGVYALLYILNYIYSL